MMVVLGLCACTGKLSGADSADAPAGAATSGNGGDGGTEGGSGGSTSGRPSEPGQPENGPYVASASLARRLSRVEFDNTVKDLLGDDSAPASRLLPEDPYAPYDNAYLHQRASAALIDSLSALSEDVAQRVVSDPEMRARVITCQPASEADEECFRQVVRELLPRAFRRPVDEAEAERYLGLLDFATEDVPEVDTGFDTAVQLLLQAVLMDPEFLYRVEVGRPGAAPDVLQLDDYEIASRLSYLLWGTAPDDALLADAERGGLHDASDRLQVARRMLEDPRARVQVQRFHAMWLGYRVVPHDAALAAAFQRETAALVDRVVFEEPQEHTHLLTFTETFIDDTLAEHYGLPLPGAEGWVDYGDSGRAGLLSHGSFLSAFGKFSDTSPTQRGILVRERLLCQPIAPPPPTVMADQPPSEGESMCKVDRYAAHRESASCAACHNQMDPIGFGLENFDLAGRFREHDEGLPECMIDGQGELPPYGTFSGPAELAERVLDSGEFPHCIAQQLMTFALGRAPTGNEQAELDRLTVAMADDGGQLIGLLLAIVGSDAFASRLEPEEVGP